MSLDFAHTLFLHGPMDTIAALHDQLAARPEDAYWVPPCAPRPAPSSHHTTLAAHHQIHHQTAQLRAALGRPEPLPILPQEAILDRAPLPLPTPQGPHNPHRASLVRCLIAIVGHHHPAFAPLWHRIAQHHTRQVAMALIPLSADYALLRLQSDWNPREPGPLCTIVEHLPPNALPGIGAVNVVANDMTHVGHYTMRQPDGLMHPIVPDPRYPTELVLNTFPYWGDYPSLQALGKAGCHPAVLQSLYTKPVAQARAIYKQALRETFVHQQPPTDTTSADLYGEPVDVAF